MKDQQETSVKIHKSLTERPLPFFGAGPTAFAISMALIYFGSMFGGLISLSTLGAIIMSALITWGIKTLRKVDPFGPEAFTIGATTPRLFEKGYDPSSEACEPYSVFPSKMMR